MMLNICSDGDILKVMRLIKIIITIIRIVVPLLLIYSLAKGYLDTVKSGELDKELKKSVTKIVAAVIIFLVPTFVRVIVKFTDVNNNYYDCISNSTKDGIESAYVNTAKSRLETAKQTLSIGDYNAAYEAYKEVNTKSEKDNLSDELVELQSAINIKREIDILSNDYSDAKYNSINSEISRLNNSEYKSNLSSKLNTVRQTAISNANNNSSSNTTTSGTMNGWILIGDSRFVGMSNVVGSSRLAKDGVTIIAKSSMGYDWLINSAIPEVDRILSLNPGKKYYIYSNLGVNGISNTKYAGTLNQLAAGKWSGNKVGYISVNPYVGYSEKSVSQNQRIVNLNNDQKSKLVNVKFCDTYNGIGQSNFTSNGDLVHYDSNTYIRIYEYIINNCR